MDTSTNHLDNENLDAYFDEIDKYEKKSKKSSKLIDQNESSNKMHIRHVILFYFRKGKRIGRTTEKICEVYGDGAISKRTVGKWFKRFKAGKFNLEDQGRSGRPMSADGEKLKALLYENPRYSIRELGIMLGLSKSTVHEHLTKFGYVNSHDVWVPKNLDKKIMADRLSICDQLIKRNHVEPFLHRLIVGGEKWIIFNNAECGTKKTNDLLPRNSHYSIDHSNNKRMINFNKINANRKALLSVWWDYKGLLYWELMEYQEQLTPELYGAQLDILRYHIQHKRPELSSINQSESDNDNYNHQPMTIIYHHDNVRAHKSEITIDKITKQFEWEILSHPSYSPDISPSDYHLFRSLQTSLYGKQFQELPQIDEHIQTFFNKQTEKFWHDGIAQLPDRWKKVIELDGAYVK